MSFYRRQCSRHQARRSDSVRRPEAQLPRHHQILSRIRSASGQRLCRCVHRVGGDSRRCDRSRCSAPADAKGHLSGVVFFASEEAALDAVDQWRPVPICACWSTPTAARSTCSGRATSKSRHGHTPASSSRARPGTTIRKWMRGWIGWMPRTLLPKTHGSGPRPRTANGSESFATRCRSPLTIRFDVAAFRRWGRISLSHRRATAR